MVHYLPMVPLLKENTPIEEADYILYMHPYARLHEFSKIILTQLNDIIKRRKPTAEIIIVGKATNIKKYLPENIPNLTFYDTRFTQKLGKRFQLNIEEQYFAYDELQHT